MDIGILILRAVIGLTIAAHGAQKLFGWFNGHGFAGTSGWLQSMGFRPGRIYAGLSGGSEFVGGLLLALGFLTPVGGAAVVGAMIAATVVVHWSNGFFASNGGYEYPLAIAAAAIAIAFVGPGAYSVDSALSLGLSGNAWGAASAIVGAATAGIVATRRRPAPQPQPVEVHDEPKAA